MQRSALCRSRRELSNAYLPANIGVDTAENEPLEVSGKIIQYYSFVSLGDLLQLIKKSGFIKEPLAARLARFSTRDTRSDPGLLGLRALIIQQKLVGARSRLYRKVYYEVNYEAV